MLANPRPGLNLITKPATIVADFERKPGAVVAQAIVGWLG